jgi:hypothetical protein
MMHLERSANSHCSANDAQMVAAMAANSPSVTRAAVLLSDQTALAAIERTECLVWWDGGDELGEIPQPFGFLRRLHLLDN